MAASNPRVGGVYTAFTWRGTVIGFCDETAVTAVQPVAAAVPVQPMNARRPVEIVTSGGHGAGTIVLTLTELYNLPVWSRLAGLASSNDISEIMQTVSGLDGGDVQVQRIVSPPPGNGDAYVETFHQCVITNVQDDEDITVDTMLINKQVTIMYTYSEKSYAGVVTSNAAKVYWP